MVEDDWLVMVDSSSYLGTYDWMETYREIWPDGRAGGQADRQASTQANRQTRQEDEWEEK